MLILRLDTVVAKFPFVSIRQVGVLTRLMTAIIFMAHAIVRIIDGSIPQFGSLMESVGFPNGELTVWIITFSELVAGCLLAANRLVRPAASVRFLIAGAGIALIHWRFGWFVGEHGTGGSEYSVALMLLLLNIMAQDREASR